MGFLKQYYLAFASFILILVVSMLVHQEVKKRAWEQNQALFEYRTEQLKTTIERRFGYYTHILKSAHGLYAVAENIDRNDWQVYIHALEIYKNYPGIQGIGFAPCILPDNLGTHIEAVRSEGFPMYRIHPSGSRPMYTPTVFLEPFDARNQRALGYDMYSDSVRRKAMERARDFNQPSLTGIVTLVQETETDVQPGFLLYLPVYADGNDPETVEERRRLLQGFVYSPFRANDLMNAIVANEFADIDIELYDGTDLRREALFFNKDTTIQYFSPKRPKSHAQLTTLQIGGHTWTMYISSLPGFGSSSGQDLANFILTGGIVISCLMFSVSWSLINRRKAAQVQQTITDNATAALFMMDINGHCTFMNPAAEQMTGYTFDEIRHKPLHDMIHHTHPDGTPFPMSECPIDSVLPTNNDMRNHEDVFVRKDGTFFHVTCAARPIFEDGIPVATVIEVRDITEEKRIKQEILESAEQQKLILEAMPQIAWTATPTGEFNYYNQRWFDYTGIPFEQAKGSGWQVAVHPEDLPRSIHLWNEALQSLDNFRVEYRFKRASNGEYRWHLGEAMPIRNEKNEVTLWVGTFTDIHDEKVREEALWEYNKRLEALNRIGKTISAELELNKLVQEVIDATTELSGAEFGALFYTTVDESGQYFTLYNLSGAPIEAFSHFPLPRNTAVFSPTFHGTGIVRSDDITQDSRYGKNAPYFGMPEGHLPVRSYLAVPVVSRNGEVLGGLFFGHSKSGVFTENTEALVKAIAAQASVAIDNARLFESSQAARKQLAQMNQELTKTNEELLKINTDLDNFIYTASHDLKSPIANLEGLITRLNKKLGSKVEAKESMLLDLMEVSINRLKKTILDLTEITKVQKNVQEASEWQRFEEVMQEVQTDLLSMISETGASIHTDFSAGHVQYARKDLRSILYNLVSNAIKYRSPDRPAIIKIRTEPEGDYILFTIQDNGLGVSESQQHKLFTMFKRLHTHVEGTGIGLYIVKRIVENNGGKIEFESHEGQGTTFRIYFKSVLDSKHTSTM